MRDLALSRLHTLSGFHPDGSVDHGWPISFSAFIPPIVEWQILCKFYFFTGLPHGLLFEVANAIQGANAHFRLVAIARNHFRIDDLRMALDWGKGGGNVSTLVFKLYFVFHVKKGWSFSLINSNENKRSIIFPNILYPIDFSRATSNGECYAPFLSNPFVNMSMYLAYYWTTLVAMLILYKVGALSTAKTAWNSSYLTE
jgi:hypothetical protein